MIYLDNAATTNYKPQEVLNALAESVTKYPYNPNRSGNKLAVLLQKKLLSTRQKIADFVNAGQAHVVFTSGCTAALNTAILGTARRGHIIISATEHNSVARPVMRLKERGFADVTVLPPDENGLITPQTLQNALRKDTYLFCLSHASNVTGQRQHLTELGKICRANGIVFLADCAQTAGYCKIDMQRDCIDVLAFGAHKGLHGIQGTGALVFAKNVQIRPICFGGTGTESNLLTQPTALPEALESGTLPCPAIMAMGAAIDWSAKNAEESTQVIVRTQGLLLDGLQRIRGVKVYSKANRTGIVAFNVKNLDSNLVADLLADKMSIAVRGGLQCAPLMHRHIGTTNSGVVRASVSCVTTARECFALLEAVQYLADKFSQ